MLRPSETFRPAAQKAGGRFSLPPGAALLLVILVILFGWLPEWGAAVWQLFEEKPFFDWLVEKMQTTQLAFSLYWITIPVSLLMFFKNTQGWFRDTMERARFPT